MSEQQAPRWKRYLSRWIAAEISTFSRYYDEIIHWHPLEHDDGIVFNSIECPSKKRLAGGEALRLQNNNREWRSIIFMNGTFNHHLNIQDLLSEIRPVLTRGSRIVALAFNPYFAWLYRLANRLGLRKGEQPCTFVTRTDLTNIAKISGYEVVRVRPTAYVPFPFLGLGSFLNYILPSIPLLRWLSLTSIIVLRPVVQESVRPSLSIVIPTRNEKGNIENALKRIPDLKCNLEIIFVEGHSTDQTWEEIQRVLPLYEDRFKIKALQQKGKGKVDAVRLGFSHATGDVLTILDGDLTMPPELLGRFYEAYVSGLADFVNGNRLVYPMEGEAMRFLNHLGNIFFAKALSTVLDSRLGDTLCGTKLLSRRDYQRFVHWREDFGDFDPFGDFELLFPAAVLGLGVVDVPIRYRARTYGTTNIHRFRHGLILLQMTLVGFFRIRMSRKPKKTAVSEELLGSL